MEYGEGESEEGTEGGGCDGGRRYVVIVDPVA